MDSFQYGDKLVAAVFDRQGEPQFSLSAVGGTRHVCVALIARVESGFVLFLASQYEEFCPMLHSHLIARFFEEEQIKIAEILCSLVIANDATKEVQLLRNLLRSLFSNKPAIEILRPGLESAFGPRNPLFFRVEISHQFEQGIPKQLIHISDGTNSRLIYAGT